ncbi:MAG TPA: cytochrome-c oxidase, cbb3-type subunit III, partial [Burkholderiaceae bacterium]|nr:cytochrome-c oxidase, cbb3-type subunit III [Burkholderiaceae bacterium]
MSDFYSVFWDYYVAIISVASVIGCAVFLKVQSRRRVVVAPGQQPETTGHVWDGDLREFHNPMPRWWIVLFYLTVLFSIVYLILYPGLGTQFKGLLKWTSTGQHAEEVKRADAKYGPLFAAYLQQPIEKVAADPRARQMGERIFLNNCAQCHGSDARGARGFPNLADSEWLWGGTPEAIVKSITEGRQGMMPPMAAAVGSAEDVADVAHYVLSLSNSAHDSVRAVRGKAKFAACAACHGADGKGNPQVGAPDLTNRLWTYGGSTATIAETITRGRQG